MKIISFHAENIKRLKAVDITPTDNCIVISGFNEQGKSSVIEAMWLALQYKDASKKIPYPLRVGTTKGEVTLDIGNYIITRKFTENGTTLEIRTPDGNKVTSPQKILDGIIGEISFDPSSFMDLSEKAQRDMLGDLLFKITDGKLNLAEFDAKRQQTYDKRTDAHREKTRITNVLKSLSAPIDSDPKEETSIVELTSAIEENYEVERLTKDITETELRLAQLKKQLGARTAQDSAALRTKLATIETSNKRAREVISYNKLMAELSAIEQNIQQHNDEIELIDIEKAEALEASPLPINDLIITADGVKTLNKDGLEIPLCQASTAQAIKICTKIGMLANPTLRVMYFKNAAYLDGANLKIIQDLAKDQDYQIWLEHVSKDENDRPGVFIEDGMVN